MCCRVPTTDDAEGADERARAAAVAALSGCTTGFLVARFEPRAAKRPHRWQCAGDEPLNRWRSCVAMAAENDKGLFVDALFDVAGHRGLYSAQVYRVAGSTKGAVPADVNTTYGGHSSPWNTALRVHSIAERCDPRCAAAATVLSELAPGHSAPLQIFLSPGAAFGGLVARIEPCACD